MEKLELRVMSSSLTVNPDGEDMVVEGLVNKTESWSHTLGKRKKFKEKIEKGAFSRAIQEADRIDFLGEHRTDMLLATTENNSLELWEDEEGLKMRAKIAPTSYGKDLYTLMKHNMVNHMSFGFRALTDKWSKRSDGIFERSIDSLILKEVSVVRNPAYPQSAISARGIDIIEDVEIPDEICEEIRTEEVVTEPVAEPVVETQPVAEPTPAPVEQPQQPEQQISAIMTDILNKFKADLISELKPKQEEQKVVTQEVVVEQPLPEVVAPIKVEEKVEPIQETKPEPVDSSKGVADLLAKYKDLQKLK